MCVACGELRGACVCVSSRAKGIARQLGARSFIFVETQHVLEHLPVLKLVHPHDRLLSRAEVVGFLPAPATDINNAPRRQAEEAAAQSSARVGEPRGALNSISFSGALMAFAAAP